MFQLTSETISYRLQFDGASVKCIVGPEDNGKNYLEAETTRENLNKDPVVGTLRRYKKCQVPNPHWTPQMPEYTKEIDEERVVAAREGVRLPADVVAYMRFKVAQAETPVRLTNEYLDALFKED